MIELKEPEPVTIVGPPKPVVCLDLGCGQNKRAGTIGVDAYDAPGVDVVHDLLEFPWPWTDAEVDEVHCSHFLEHIPGRMRLIFFDELWRVMKVGGKALFITPAADSNRAVQDPSHAWPPVVPEFYQYLNRAWREANKLTHGFYEVKCNFDYAPSAVLDPDIAPRSDEYRTFAIRHYRNATVDLHMTLTRLA